MFENDKYESNEEKIEREQSEHCQKVLFECFLEFQSDMELLDHLFSAIRNQDYEAICDAAVDIINSDVSVEEFSNSFDEYRSRFGDVHRVTTYYYDDGYDAKILDRRYV